ncbi:MAG: hypothetical protein HKO66_01160 [Saprospiraceae bacterium]|nr:hypothetical protein [Bacteroidia bacterium]NNE14868.1 hypothetical protein [Saprospiraceae bacterium]NNL90817.1 hypothetical protein [Saprospiraceae bacterium]
MEELIGLLAVVGFFGSIITFIYMRYKSKHQQRMALIDSGQSADLLVERNLDNKSNALKNGMFFTGAGLGFFTGVLFESFLRIEEGLAILPLSFVGGGLGLILFYSVVSRRDDH